MATEEIVNNTKYISLSRKEALNIICFLSGQLAEESTLNYGCGACPEILIKSEDFSKRRMSFAENSNTKQSYEIKAQNEDIIVLSRLEATRVVTNLVEQLAGHNVNSYTGSCVTISVFDKGHVLYDIVFVVDKLEKEIKDSII